MRTSIGPIDTRALDWEPMSDLLRYKLLNGSMDGGAYTMILQSDSRTPQEHRGQYHPADEEFYCLAGDFTFDGSTWFKPGSYAFYPAYFVHGTRVHVRGGYEVYLRIGGTNELYWEDYPKSDVPYPKSQAKLPDYAIQLPEIESPKAEAVKRPINGVAATALHQQQRSGHASTLLTVESDTSLVLSTEDVLEVFALGGTFEDRAGTQIGPHTYLCWAEPQASTRLVCFAGGQLLVSHDADLIISRG